LQSLTKIRWRKNEQNRRWSSYFFISAALKIMETATIIEKGRFATPQAGNILQKGNISRKAPDPGFAGNLPFESRSLPGNFPRLSFQKSG